MAEEVKDQSAVEESAAQVSSSPLFMQVAAMMAACSAAKDLVESVTTKADGGITPEHAELLTEKLVKLGAHLRLIDFEHGEEIVKGAAQAFDMAAPNVDIICSGFGIGMPKKSENPKKLIFIRGRIANNKYCMMYLDQPGAEQTIKSLTENLDILYPRSKIVGLDGKRLSIDN